MNQEQPVDVVHNLIAAGCGLGGLFLYFLVGAIYAGIAKRITGSKMAFFPNLVVWPFMMPIHFIMLIYCLASGDRIEDVF